LRYNNIRNIEFTNANGNVYKIKDRRPIPVYKVLTNYNKTSDEFGDEIAVKREIYGENAESLAYRIFEANTVALIENRFDFTKLKNIVIPTIED